MAERLTPQKRKELEQRLASGQGLPQGYVTVPEGQAPPAGMVPTGITAQANGQPIQAPTDFTAYNPVQKDKDGYTIMRNAVKCPIPGEATQLQQNIQALLDVKADHDKVENILSRGIAVALRVNSYCDDQLKERPIVRFADDDELNGMTEEIVELTKKAQDLQKQLHKCVRKAKELYEKRWDRSVEKYGMDPSKRFYTLQEGENGENAAIFEAVLDCASCKGKTKARKARQSGTEFLRQIAQEKEREAKKSVGLKVAEEGDSQNE